MRKKRILILYPWGDILEGKGGASRRVGLLIKFLEERGYEIHVCAPCLGRGVQHGAVSYSSYQPSSRQQALTRALHKIYKALFFVLSGGRSWNEEFMFWYHHEHRLAPGFGRYVEYLVQQADTVFLEYTFWASLVAPACRRFGKPLVISTHDVLSNQVRKTRWLRTLTLRQEVKALKQADYVVCVSKGDQQVFSEYGVTSVVIPHGIDVNGLVEKPSSKTARQALRERYGSKISEGPFCLFVGSLFTANLKAIEVIRNLAKTMVSAEPPVGFLVVGGCCEPGQDGNFLSLGKVDHEVLDLLYAAADVVLIPLLTGTGASVKTIEAMAYGKVVLATKVGVRGYPVRSGINCVVSDNVEEYPKLIGEILGDPERRSRLEENARTFAREFDYRRVYEAYLPFIEEK